MWELAPAPMPVGKLTVCRRVFLCAAGADGERADGTRRHGADTEDTDGTRYAEVAERGRRKAEAGGTGKTR